MINPAVIQLSFLFKICVFVVLFSVMTPSNAEAQGAAGQCYINTAGDYICPLGGAQGGAAGNNPYLNNGNAGVNVLGAGSPLLTGLNNIPGVPGNLGGMINALLGCLSPQMQNAMLLQLAQLVGTNATAANTNAIVNQFTSACNLMNQIAGSFCGGGAGPSFMSYAQNTIGTQISLFGANLNINTAITGLCGGAGTNPGAGMPTTAGTSVQPQGAGLQCSDNGPSLGGPVGNTPGERIGNAARAMEGYSTACVTGTVNGTVACAWVVSMILREAGYPLQGGTTLSTSTLHQRLSNDPCYQVVDTGNITAGEAANLQVGDILVTPTNFDMSGNSGTCTSSFRNRPVGDPMRRCNSGHTGVYVGGGGIVSNGSEGTAGPGAGVSENYTVDSWSRITNRNTAESAVFRRTCP